MLFLTQFDFDQLNPESTSVVNFEPITVEKAQEFAREPGSAIARLDATDPAVVNKLLGTKLPNLEFKQYGLKSFVVVRLTEIAISELKEEDLLEDHEVNEDEVEDVEPKVELQLFHVFIGG